MKCILTFIYLGWKTNSAVDGFVTIVVTPIAIIVEPYRISITRCSFLHIPILLLVPVRAAGERPPPLAPAPEACSLRERAP